MLARTIPPLLALAQGRKPRLRKAPVIRPKEILLHMKTAAILREYCLLDWRWTHVPSGERQDPRTAAKLKAMGLGRGWPDFQLFSPEGRPHFLELKRPPERLTEDQEDFRQWCVKHGVPHAIAHSANEVLAAFERWQCLRIEVKQERT